MSNDAAESTTDAAPAVSARVLKKRETDRRCQRMIRERTKSHISYLEGIVEQFRQQDASGRVQTLMKQLSDVKEERDALAKQVKTIGGIVSGMKLKEEPDDSHDSPMLRLGTSEYSPPAQLQIEPRWHDATPRPTEHSFASKAHDAAAMYAVYNKEYRAYVESSARATWCSSTAQSPSEPACECSSHYSSVDSNKVINNWRYANDTLTEWFKWSPQTLDMARYEPFNDDIPVRAVVEGWDAVEQTGNMHPIWRLLKGIDQNLFASCEPRERLAILTVMGLLIQAHINPTTEQHRKLPSFYLKRPSQDMLHSYATEYFAWPGLRERFIFSEHRYCSNIFWQVFCKSLRFQWPYEFRDCYVRNTDTGLYRISPTFHERVSDIRCWTMGMDMFKQYPELYADIPAWNHIPASVAPIAQVQNMARRALPSIATVENRAKREEPSARDQGQGQGQGQVQPSDHLHHHSSQQHQHQHQHLQQHAQTAYFPYPLSGTSSSFEPRGPDSPFDFQAAGILPTTIADTQQVAGSHNWDFNGGLDLYAVNTT